MPETWNSKVFFERPDGRFFHLYWFRGEQKVVIYCKLLCEGCGETRFSSATNVKKAKGKTYCRKCQSAHSANTQRKGRIYKRGSMGGHILVYAPEHPAARHGYVLEHRLVVEKTLGRFLTKSEFVHHIDCDQQNNLLENLVVVDSGSHNRAHGSLNKLVKKLMDRGIIEFDRENVTYLLKGV